MIYVELKVISLLTLQQCFFNKKELRNIPEFLRGANQI